MKTLALVFIWITSALLAESSQCDQTTLNAWWRGDRTLSEEGGIFICITFLRVAMSVFISFKFQAPLYEMVTLKETISQVICKREWGLRHNTQILSQ
jgi:hypothetical protein